jgi:hypothetical protein
VVVTVTVGIGNCSASERLTMKQRLRADSSAAVDQCRHRLELPAFGAIWSQP